MNKLDIIKALRQLDRDIRELGQSPITKRSARALLASDPGTKGGLLVQWFNDESDDRTKAMIHEVITLVNQAGNIGREDKIPQAAKQLGPLVNRLAEDVEGAVVETTPTRHNTTRHNTTRHDTKDDIGKKVQKKRPMNTKAADCARRYREDKGRTPMKTVVEDYVDQHGGSFDTIMRVLNDNPDQWKTTDQTRHKDDN